MAFLILPGASIHFTSEICFSQNLLCLFWSVTIFYFHSVLFFDNEKQQQTTDVEKNEQRNIENIQVGKVDIGHCYVCAI